MLFNEQFNTCYASANYTPEITDITVIENASLVNLECSGPYSLTTCFNLPPLTYGYIEIPFEVSDTPSEERKASIIEHSLQIIPNPTIESVQIVVGNSVQATLFIYNSPGILLDQRIIDGGFQYDVSNYAAGVYTVRAVFTDGEVITEKMVVL